VDTIECQYCHKNGTPHLWHYQPFPTGMRYLKAQHICRLCGGVMYETGGGISPVGWICAIFCATVLSFIVTIAMPGSVMLNAAVSLGKTALSLYIGYRLVKFIIGKFK
jgi:hypothetical protein